MYVTPTKKPTSNINQHPTFVLAKLPMLYTFKSYVENGLKSLNNCNTHCRCAVLYITYTMYYTTPHTHICPPTATALSTV